MNFGTKATYVSDKLNYFRNYLMFFQGLKLLVKASGKHKQRVSINLSQTGVVIKEEKTEVSVSKYVSGFS